MYYYTTIKNMMKESKDGNEKAVVTNLGDGKVIFVKYFEQFDDYTLQYSWPLKGDEDTIKQEVLDNLSTYTNEIPTLELIQVGMVTLYHTNAEVLCRVIEECEKENIKPERDTKYVFAGNKVYRVAKFFDKYSCPFEHAEHLRVWDEPHISEMQKDLKTNNIMKGSEYHYDEKNKIAKYFLGCIESNVSFSSELESKVPTVFILDTIMGKREFW